MLTKEECLEALTEIKMYGSINIPLYSLEVIENLIGEHFSNPPLKWDELNKGYPIYDNDEIVCGWKFIYMIDKEYKQLLLIDEEGNVDWVNYEENRFYRKEVQE